MIIEIAIAMVVGWVLIQTIDIWLPILGYALTIAGIFAAVIFVLALLG